MTALIIIVAVLLVAALLVRHVLRRGSDIQQLGQNGSAVVGTVTEAKAQRRSRVQDYYFISYTFRAFDGVEYSRRFRVEKLEFANYREGMPIDLVYLPADPSVNALASTVVQMRAAMSKTP